MWPARLVYGQSVAWQGGYLAALIGLGDPCPYVPATVDAINWRDGHAVALQLLRELPEE